ncbi:MAG: bifunctional folylpolyglutamate synthase/dihydrofolate synthase [Bacteroidetes bacterium]|nr:bifunctional folylpolyglutamate synthase/dihydrofolate synthase [Bacteroidota bacterium]
MNRNYQDTLQYLFSRLPVFQHIGKAAYKANLDNTISLAKYFQNPENSFKSIHVAGTNGKGSVSSMLAAIFTTHGYKTGLYTSPHLKDFTERIRIDGKPVPEQFVIDFTEKAEPIIEEISPSFFELTVAMAFDYFRQEKVDIAIIETGMGGRLDSTNIITPVLSVITNIGYDHMEFLGDTIAKIASEKAGIIKPGIPVVIGESNDESLPVFVEKALQENAELFLADNFPEIWEAALELKGAYQKKNLATLTKCIEVLRVKGYKLQDELISNALQHVKTLSGIRGRWEIIQENPMVITDTGHNEHGLKYVTQQLHDLNPAKLHMVLGVVNDKDLSKILPLFPTEAVYYFARPNILRGLDANILREKAMEYHLYGQSYNSVNQALIAAKNASTPKDIIFVGGSTFVVAEVL